MDNLLHSLEAREQMTMRAGARTAEFLAKLGVPVYGTLNGQPVYSRPVVAKVLNVQLATLQKAHDRNRSEIDRLGSYRYKDSGYSDIVSEYPRSTGHPPVLSTAPATLRQLMLLEGSVGETVRDMMQTTFEGAPEEVVQPLMDEAVQRIIHENIYRIDGLLPGGEMTIGPDGTVRIKQGGVVVAEETVQTSQPTIPDPWTREDGLTDVVYDQFWAHKNGRGFNMRSKRSYDVGTRFKGAASLGSSGRSMSGVFQIYSCAIDKDDPTRFFHYVTYCHEIDE